MYELPEVDYTLSLHNSKFIGYQSKNKNTGKITIYIATLWKWILERDYTLDHFVSEIIFITILERICLERAFQKIRMKNRCEPICSMEKYAVELYREM